MQSPTVLCMLTLVFSVTLALTNASNTTITPPDRYYLQTKVIGAECPDKNGLYVSGYHTGAGTSDITLGSIDVASIGFLNGSYQQFDYNSSFPWGLEMGGDSNYAAWEFANIDAIYGQGSGSFFFNASGLQWDAEEDGFSGWLACDWWHGLPQLFWLYEYYTFPLPSSCAEIQLLPIAV